MDYIHAIMEKEAPLRFFKAFKDGMKGYDHEIDKDEFMSEVSRLVEKTFDPCEHDWFEHETNAGLTARKKALGPGWDCGDYVLFARQDSPYDEINLYFFEQPKYDFNGNDYKTLKDAVEAMNAQND